MCTKKVKGSSITTTTVPHELFCHNVWNLLSKVTFPSAEGFLMTNVNENEHGTDEDDDDDDDDDSESEKSEEEEGPPSKRRRITLSKMHAKAFSACWIAFIRMSLPQVSYIILLKKCSLSIHFIIKLFYRIFTPGCLCIYQTMFCPI